MRSRIGHSASSRPARRRAARQTGRTKVAWREEQPEQQDLFNAAALDRRMRFVRNWCPAHGTLGRRASFGDARFSAALCPREASFGRIMSGSTVSSSEQTTEPASLDAKAQRTFAAGRYIVE